MTGSACGSCTAPTADGARLCTGCTRDLAQLLLTAASIAPDLDDAVARLLKRGNGGRSSSPEPPLPVDLNASVAAAALRQELATWVGAVAVLRPRRQMPGLSSSAMAIWLRASVTDLRQHERAADAHRQIRTAVHRALDVIDRPAERAPAGQCAACGKPLMAELGADTVTCRCGTLATALLDKRRQRAQAADVLGTAAEISATLAAIGISVPRGTITSWASRGRLGTRGKAGLYALSDVLALKAESDQRRT